MIRKEKLFFVAGGILLVGVLVAFLLFTIKGMLIVKSAKTE